MILFSITLWETAQPPTPEWWRCPGANNSPVGGGPAGTPIDGGHSIMLVMGLAYGAKKVYQVKKEN